MNSTYLNQCCATGFIAPFGLPQNSFCCNVIAPVSPTFGSQSGGPTICSQIDCSSYAPTCFVPTSTNLCGYLQGIDTKLCALGVSLSSIPCASITMAGPYACLVSPINPPINTLCDFATAVNNNFCVLQQQIYGLETNTGGTGVSGLNGVTDGGNGTLSGASGTVGMVGTNGTISSDSTVTHGTSTSSLKIFSTGTTGTGVVNTSTPITVTAGKVYEVHGYVYVNGQSPNAGVVSAVINGSGSQIVLKSQSTNPASFLGGWYSFSTRYVPDVNQSITIGLKTTSFTIGTWVNFADVVFMPLTETNAGANYEYEIPQQRDINSVYNAIASSFVISNTYTTAGLYLTVGQDTYIIKGKYVIGAKTQIGLLPNTTNYVYYDTWTDGYVVKATNVTDTTQILLYSVVTNGSVISTITSLFNTAPFNGSSIQAGTIPGAQLINNTITDTQLSNTGVTANPYGDSTHVPVFTVSAAGRISTVTPTLIAFPVTSVNGATGTVSLGIANMNDATITTPSAGQFLKWNGTKWVNSAITPAYYQTIYSNLVSVTQRAKLNFNTIFSVTDDSSNGATTIGIAAYAITYGLIQKAVGAAVLLGNSAGANSPYVEQTLSNDLVLSGNVLSVNYVALTKSGTSYNVAIADISGGTTILMTNSGARSVVLPAANTVATGRPIRVKDANGNASSANITVTVASSGTIDGASSIVISTNYGHNIFMSDGINWYTI